MTRRFFLAVAGSAVALAQKEEPKASEPQATEPQFVCPMDPDVKSARPGTCPRCGMQLVARILEPVGYSLEMETRPAKVLPGRAVELSFRVLPPDGLGPAVREFELVHEKLCHLFVVSQDLSWFLHDHPVLGKDGTFRLPVTFPGDGMYELFVDLYPRGGTPQWLPHFLFSGKPVRTKPAVGKSVLRDGDTTLAVRLDPAEAFVGQRLILYCSPSPAEGMELWLGTYAHGFWISHDLVDAEHTHPLSNNGELNFQAYFPRPGDYRFWIQFQRAGKVRTTYLDIAVAG